MGDAPDIAGYLAQHESKPRLRFITCGSVDDGKSTLIGRLLFESKNLFDDQMSALARDSRRHGTQGEDIDYALLLDGLDAEREQGITIDVAYRYFSTDKRSYIVADCPGHEQYTRNMATGASTADLAIVLVDARKGLLTQTRRHTYIAALFGIKHVVLAVNKMDLVDYSRETFEQIEMDYRGVAATLGIARVTAIPLSGLKGDNVVARSDSTPWYRGPALMEFLDMVELGDEAAGLGFRMPVQWVCRPSQDFRGFTGPVVSGRVSVGDRVSTTTSGKVSKVKSIAIGDRAVDSAFDGQSILLTLEDEIDVSRGDVLAAADSPPATSDQFGAHLLWMGDHALLPGRHYWLKLGTRTVSCVVTEIRYKADINTQEQLAAKRLELNEVASVHISLDQPIAFESHADNRLLGSFILIDRQTFATVACGTLDFALHRAANVHWQALDVDQSKRASMKGQQARCLWFTGLSGSGKSTIANLAEKRLVAAGHHTYILDGDNVRHGLNRDLGFTEEDRVENIRRVAEVAKLMVDAGLIVLTAFISPFRAERRLAREILQDGEFVEVFVDTPLAVAEERDVKGLYKKARAGQLKNFTGIDSPYEAPEAPELRIDTTEVDPVEAAERIVAWLE